MIGQRREGRVEVTDGLGPDDVVVTAGAIKLREGVSVSIANAGTGRRSRRQGLDGDAEDMTLPRSHPPSRLRDGAVDPSPAVGLSPLGAFRCREYPRIDEPSWTVETRYVGASAEVVESQITKILEDSLAGIEAWT